MNVKLVIGSKNSSLRTIITSANPHEPSRLNEEIRDYYGMLWDDKHNHHRIIRSAMIHQ